VGVQKLTQVYGIILALLIGCSAGWAQTAASIQGTVRDPTDLAVSGATIYLENNDTKASRTTATDDSGVFQFQEVTPGPYTIRAEKTGFKSVAVARLEVFVNTPTSVFLKFTEVGQLSDVVFVSGVLPPINSVDASVGSTIERKQIADLPLPGLDVSSLISLQAGIAFTGITDPILPDTRGGAVAGVRSDQTNFTLDGADVNDQQTGGAFRSVLSIPSESIGELRMLTANATVNQGRSSGGQVSAITRSGTNDFHGSLYEYLRNTATNANTFFNNATIDPVTGTSISRPKNNRNIFGGSLGGPIKKNRLFFFVNIEDNIARKEEPQLRVVPSSTLREGILQYIDSDGAIQSVSASQLRAMDPQTIGANADILALFRQYPIGNDPTQGDAGLNFTGLRFNAPLNEDKLSYVARIDYNSPNSRHKIFARGSLSDFTEDAVAQQFPGQPASQILINNSKGTSLGYTWTISSKMINVANWGYTRQGLNYTGSSINPGLTLFGMDDALNFAARNNSRIVPVHNFTDDLTWVKGPHTLQFGVNYRSIHNKRSSEEKTYPTYLSNPGTMEHLGQDLLPDGIDANFQSPYIQAQMALLGTINQSNITYFVNLDGSVIPSPAIPHREFINNEFEWYAEDQWKLPHHVTLTAGVRYSYYSPPWEKNGMQVRADFDVNAWFAKRKDGADQGLPSSTNPLLSFVPAGKANHAAPFFDPDKNNFAPRFALAWSPSFENGLLHKLFGYLGQSSVRFGASKSYDRSGGTYPITADSEGAVGLSTSLMTNTGAYNYETAPRFSGFQNLGSIAVPPPPTVGFPSTPDFSGNIGFMVDSKLRTPYYYTFSFSVSRELPSHLTLELGYLGRIGRKLMVQNDYAAPLVNFRDPKSRQTWTQAAGIIADYLDQGVPADQVPQIPYIENVFAPLATDSTSATAEFYNLASGYAPSWTDLLRSLDASTIYGEHTFFQQQYLWLPTWTNLGKSNYNSMQVILRKRLSTGLQADFNYTFSKSLDNGSAVESEGRGAGQILNAFAPQQTYARSDFDIRHQINSNFIYDLPFGTGRQYGANSNPAVKGLISGWTLSGIVRWRTGFPFATISGNGQAYPTNFAQYGPSTVRPGATLPEVEVTKDAAGGPNIFPDAEKAYDAFQNTRSGFSGNRNVLYGPGFFTLDTGLQKTFKLNSQQQIQFRWETFNVMNTVNFDGRAYPGGNQGISFELDARSTFGQLRTLAGSPRFMQFALRYSF
jgi:hypothetical protein